MCSICGEESTRICARCTKDSCNNHLCEKCLCCSDCCECEVVLSETSHPVVRPVHRPVYGEDVVDEIEDGVDDIPEEEDVPHAEAVPEPEDAPEIHEEPAEEKPVDAAAIPAEPTQPPSET